VGLFGEVRDLYRQSRKPYDIFWNNYVSRPVAALVLAFVRHTPLTPNQVTFLSLAVALAGDATLVLAPTYAGLIGAALVLQASYVLDCVDGQLARLKAQTTPVGAHLDFLMDELKAFALVAAASARLWRVRGDPRMLALGLAGLCVVASAISLTTFMRRPEYAPPPPKTGFAPPPPLPRSPIRLAIALGLRLGRFIVHYPSYFVWVALSGHVEAFLYPYIAVNAVYLLQCMAQIILKLGRPRPQSAA
jgi:phosphatidylglycerophosphate synthase